MTASRFSGLFAESTGSCAVAWRSASYRRRRRTGVCSCTRPVSIRSVVERATDHQHLFYTPNHLLSMRSRRSGGVGGALLASAHLFFQSRRYTTGKVQSGRGIIAFAGAFSPLQQLPDFMLDFSDIFSIGEPMITPIFFIRRAAANSPNHVVGSDDIICCSFSFVCFASHSSVGRTYRSTLLSRPYCDSGRRRSAERMCVSIDGY